MGKSQGHSRMCAMSARLSRLCNGAGRAEAVPCAARGGLRLALGAGVVRFGNPARGDAHTPYSGSALEPYFGLCAGVFFGLWSGLVAAPFVFQALVFAGRMGWIRPRTGPAFVVSFPVRRALGTAFRYDSIFRSFPSNGRRGPFGSFVSVLGTSRYERNGYKRVGEYGLDYGVGICCGLRTARGLGEVFGTDHESPRRGFA